MSRKYALIIGNTEYIDPGLAQLTAPGRDAEDFGRVLKDQDIGAFDNVTVLVNEPSSYVIEAIDEFFDQKKPDDMLVLYFSGHGIKDEIGSLYLAFKNTIRSRLRSTAIKSDYIREAMDQSRSKRQVLILDCCNSGAFPQGTKAALGGSMGMTQAFQGYGRFVLTASDATQFAWEGDKLIGETDNSLFTHFLVTGLQGEADSDGDGRITVDELYDYAYQQISKITPKQTPTKSASRQEGEIVLRQNMRIEDIKPVPLPDDLISEIEDLRPLVREGAVQRLERILKGRNIGMARSAVEALEKIAADENTTRRVAQAATQALDAFRQIERKAEEERKAREQEEHQAILKAEEERLALAKAEADRKAREETEKLLRAQAERKAAEHEAARLKAEREAAEAAARESAEKAAKEKAEREAVERAATLKAEHDAMELAAQKKTEREAAERAEREAIELAARRKAEREAAGLQVPKKTTKSSASSFLKWGIVGVLALCGLAGGAWGISYWRSFSDTPTQAPIPQATEILTEIPVEVPPPVAAGEKVLIRWFVGLGSGSNAEQIEPQEEVVRDFNASQSNIELILEVVSYDQAVDALASQIASGTGPDIVGPVGWSGSNSFYGEWLDLEPYVRNTSFNSIFNPALIEFYQTEEGQVGLPFAVFPAGMYYIPSIFDKAGLSYPPDRYGAEYFLDGRSVEWNWDTLTEVARRLTLDVNGKSAGESGFDRNQIVQIGFEFQWQTELNHLSSYRSGAATIVKNNRSAIPNEWKTAMRWYYEGMWGDQPFMPTGPLANSPEFGNGNLFNSGRVAMAIAPIWYTCCLVDLANSGEEFQIGILPTGDDGQVHGRVDADTFRIWKGTTHPQEAFTVLSYLITTGADKLLPTYGAMPALSSQMNTFFAKKSADYPFVTQDSWNVFVQGLNYPDTPSAEQYQPNYSNAFARQRTFVELLQYTPPGQLDFNAEWQKMIDDLNELYNQ